MTRFREEQSATIKWHHDNNDNDDDDEDGMKWNEINECMWIEKNEWIMMRFLLRSCNSKFSRI